MNRRPWAFVAAAALLGTFFSVGSAPAAEAISGAEFDPGYIISNEVFFNSTAMTEAQIQGFLASKVPNCVGANGVTCLPSYTMDTTSLPASPNGQCGPYAGATAEPASRIIFKVAQTCGINPQVLIVLLQKEQGLVTATSPTTGKYRSATGYGCPDTAACDAKYYGFFNQVYRAAWQFREYTIHPNEWRYRMGVVPIQFHPDAARCGAWNVNVRNQATANLYNYTPYQPNTAALANLNGTGDSCSSYGNRNFWVYFNNWFGSPTGRISPFGAIDSISSAPGTIRVAGWAIDPDVATPINVHVYIDSTASGVVADGTRTDIGAIYTDKGPNHGFEVTLPVGGGAHRVCVYGINEGPGNNVLFGCADTSVPSGSPRGSFDSATGDANGIMVAGWALDPDVITPIDVHVYVDGGATGVVADNTRTDIGAAFPGYGPNHGFSATVAASPGNHNVCVYGINAGGGANVSFGCRTVTIPGAPVTSGTRVPVGNLDYVNQKDGTISVGGWALDPDTADPINVHVYIGQSATGISADQSRPDLAASFPQYGANHGFSASLAAPPGDYTVCVYAINNTVGANPQLGCRQVSAPGAPKDFGRVPFGSVDAITPVEGGISVGGWAIDPDTPATSITIHIYVDSTAGGYIANQSRPDVGAAYGAGDAHGFGVVVPAGAGSHRVCVYGINSGSGANSLLRCATVTVAGSSTPTP